MPSGSSTPASRSDTYCRASVIVDESSKMATTWEKPNFDTERTSESPGNPPMESSTGLGEIFHFIVRSEDPNRTLEDLRTIHDWVIKPELRKVSGVAEVNSWGGNEKQFHVIVSPEALLKYNLTLDDVFETLEENNHNVGGGQIVSGGESRLVHGIGRVTSIEEIENIVLTSYNGTPLFIKDIAEVAIGHEIRRGAVSAQGRGEAVLGLGFMLMGENSKVVTELLKERLEGVVKRQGGAPEILPDA